MVLDPIILFIASIVSYYNPDEKQHSKLQAEKAATYAPVPVHQQQTTQASFRCHGGWDGN